MDASQVAVFDRRERAQTLRLLSDRRSSQAKINVAA
jgi:hypothetical protein